MFPTFESLEFFFNVELDSYEHFTLEKNLHHTNFKNMEIKKYSILGKKTSNYNVKPHSM